MDVCCVCDEVFDASHHAPKLLPCLHLTCSLCVNDLLISSQQTNQQAACFVCHEPFCDNHVVALHQNMNSNCMLHNEKYLVAFCEPCQTLVCEDCAITEHYNHSCVLLAELVRVQRDSLQARLNKITESLASLEAAQQELHILHNRLLVRLDQLPRSIREAFDLLIGDLRINLEQRGQDSHAAAIHRCISRLENRCEFLLAMAYGQLKSNIKTTETQQYALDIAYSHIIAAQQQAVYYLGHTDQITLVDEFCRQNIVCSRFRHLQEAELVLEPMAKDNLRFCFNAPSDVVNTNISTLGELTRERDYSTIAQPSLIFGAKGDEPGLFHNPTGIARLSSNQLIVSDYWNKRMQVFTFDGKFVRQFATSCYPYHVAVTVTGEIWVASYKSDVLQCYSNDGLLLSQISTKTPVAVAIRDDGTIITAYYSRGCVKAFAADGSERWTLNNSTVQYADDIAIVPTGELIVSNLNHSHILVLSHIDGHLISYIGTGQLDNPRGVTLIPDSNKLVVAERDCVSIWTLAGDLVHRWGSRGSQPGQFLGAYGAAVLDDGRIAVTDNENHRVQIF